MPQRKGFRPSQTPARRDPAHGPVRILSKADFAKAAAEISSACARSIDDDAFEPCIFLATLLPDGSCARLAFVSADPWLRSSGGREALAEALDSLAEHPEHDLAVFAIASSAAAPTLYLEMVSKDRKAISKRPTVKLPSGRSVVLDAPVLWPSASEWLDDLLSEGDD